MPSESKTIVQYIGEFIQGSFFKYIVGIAVAIFAVAIIVGSFTAPWVTVPEADPNLQAHNVIASASGISGRSQLRTNDVLLSINGVAVEASDDPTVLNTLYATQIERLIAEGKSTLPVEVFRFDHTDTFEIPLDTYSPVFELDLAPHRLSDVGLSTRYVAGQDFPHLEGVSISAMDVWQGGNADIPTLDLVNLVEGKTGFGAVRTVDRLLIVLPVGGLLLLILVALYLSGGISQRRALLMMVALTLILLIFPYFWQWQSADAWRIELRDHWDAQEIKNFAPFPDPILKTFNISLTRIAPRIGNLTGTTLYPVLGELVNTHDSNQIGLIILIAFGVSIVAFMLTVFEQNNMFVNSDRLIAVLMLTPTIVLLAIFVYFFIGENIANSFSDWGEESKGAPPAFELNVDKTYVGTENYDDLMTNLTERRFRTSLVNNFFFTIFFLAGCLLFGFLLAFLVDQRVRGEGMFRTIFLFPMSLSFVVTGAVWNWMLQTKGGLNYLPAKLSNITIADNHLFPEFLRADPLTYKWLTSKKVIWGFEWADTPRYLTYAGLILLGIIAFNYLLGREWRTVGIVVGLGVFTVILYKAGFWQKIFIPLDVQGAELKKGYQVALTGIIIAAVWQMSGYVMALFLAGIRGVDDELREAARVDGCAEWQVYLYIILPSLRPIVVTAVIILGHISLKIFDLVFAMSKPDQAETMVPGVLLYTKTFRGNALASGSAVAVIMLALVSLVIVPYLWSSLRSEESPA